MNNECTEGPRADICNSPKFRFGELAEGVIKGHSEGNTSIV